MIAAPRKAPRMVAFVDETMWTQGKGYRVAIVIEGEDHYRPTGTWPYTGAVGETRPWFWGPTFTDARKAMDAYNAQLGVSPEEAAIIVAKSMGMGLTKTLKHKRGGK